MHEHTDNTDSSTQLNLLTLMSAFLEAMTFSGLSNATASAFANCVYPCMGARVHVCFVYYMECIVHGVVCE